MQVLVHFRLAVQVQTNEYPFDTHAKQFFVPAVLPYYSPAASASDAGQCPAILKAAPIHISFNTGFVIPGFFTRFATTMLDADRNHAIKLGLCFERGQIYHDKVSYEMQADSQSNFVTITEHASNIELDFECNYKQPEEKFQNDCINLKEATGECCDEVIKSLYALLDNEPPAFKLSIVCQARDCQSFPTHYLSTDPFEKIIDGVQHTLVKCERPDSSGSRTHPRDITPSEAYWYPNISATAISLISVNSLVQKEFQPSLALLQSDAHVERELNEQQLKADQLLKKYQSKINKVIVSGAGVGSFVRHCETEDLITNTMMKELVSDTTGQTEKKRVFKLLDEIRSSLDVLNADTILDKFLCLLHQHCGRSGKSLSQSIASEYAYPLQEFTTALMVHSSSTADKHRALPQSDVERELNEKQLKADQLLKKYQSKINEVIVSGAGVGSFIRHCETEDLITNTMMKELVSDMTGQTEKKRVFKLLDVIRSSLDVLNPDTVLDKFLCLLHQHCGRSGNSLSQSIASEYAYPLQEFTAVMRHTSNTAIDKPHREQSLDSLPNLPKARSSVVQRTNKRQYYSKVNVTDVYHQLKHKSAHWNEFGGGLGVDWSYRENLKSEASTDQRKLEQVLEEWARSECSVVSWDTIIDMLNELEFNDVAEDVKLYLRNHPNSVSQ